MNHGSFISSEQLYILGKENTFTSRAMVKDYLSGDRIQCLCCQKPYTNLAAHLWRAHGIHSRDYKRAFNIPVCAALEGTTSLEQMRAKLKSNPKAIEHSASSTVGPLSLRAMR